MESLIITWTNVAMMSKEARGRHCTTSTCQKISQETYTNNLYYYVHLCHYQFYSSVITDVLCYIFFRSANNMT